MRIRSTVYLAPTCIISRPFYFTPCLIRVGGDADGERSVYLCGNSLGLQPRRAQTYLHEEMEKWAACGVEGHFRGARPWAHIDETVTGLTAKLVGAESADEVAVMNSLSVNMHLLLCTFYRPTDQRHKIIIEDNAFCSDNVCWPCIARRARSIPFHALSFPSH